MEMQLSQATIQDAMEIREELSRQGYVKAQKLVFVKRKSRNFLIMLPSFLMTIIFM